MHTNLDVLSGGLNDLLADKLGIINKNVIQKIESQDGKCHGLGRCGEFNKTYVFKDVINMISDVLGIKILRFVGDTKKEIKKVCVCTGSGASLIDDVIKLGADLYITGDIKYHDALNALENGLCIIDAGHYETECIVTSVIKDMLEKEYKKTLEIHIFNDKSPINYFVK